MLLRGETGYNTTALIELVQVQGAHGKTARPLRLMGHLKRLHHTLHSCSSTKFNWSEKLGVYILTKYVIVLVYILYTFRRIIEFVIILQTDFSTNIPTNRSIDQ